VVVQHRLGASNYTLQTQLGARIQRRMQAFVATWQRAENRFAAARLPIRLEVFPQRGRNFF
jgi:hypothetical protein